MQEIENLKRQNNVFEMMLIMMGQYEAVQKVKELLKNPYGIITEADLKKLLK